MPFVNMLTHIDKNTYLYATPTQSVEEFFRLNSQKLEIISLTDNKVVLKIPENASSGDLTGLFDEDNAFVSYYEDSWSYLKILGSNWETIELSSDYKILDFVSENVGFGVTWEDNGKKKLDKTTDGGHTWTTIYNKHSFGFLYDAVNANVIYKIEGEENTTNASLYKTINGGDSWETLPLDLEGIDHPLIMGLYFTSETEGFLLNSHNEEDSSVHVYKTTDGGVIWTEISGGLPVDDYQLMYYNDNNICLYNKFNRRLLQSFDGGESWEIKYVYALDLRPTFISFNTMQSGWIYGTSRLVNRPIFDKTRNAGNDWGRIYLPEYKGQIIDGRRFNNFEFYEEERGILFTQHEGYLYKGLDSESKSRWKKFYLNSTEDTDIVTSFEETIYILKNRTLFKKNF